MKELAGLAGPAGLAGRAGGEMLEIFCSELARSAGPAGLAGEAGGEMPGIFFRAGRAGRACRAGSGLVWIHLLTYNFRYLGPVNINKPRQGRPNCLWVRFLAETFSIFFCDHWDPLGWLAGLPGPAGLAGMAIQKDRDHLRQDSFFTDFFHWSLGHRTLWGPKTKVSHIEVFGDLNSQTC